ncbi:ankyrin repeat and SOCS box protein 13-like isoform X6 [Channa argus]|uniref:ankyrin repeat and SOCS box protein 13-like isoform X6 n=1 Tax=Channa argus TaxID=215402 RepID=UPI00351F8462
MEITRARPSLYGEIAHGLGFWTDRSAVHEAAAQGRVTELQQLIEGGAAVNIVAVDSITPLHEVDARNIDGSTPLCDACSAGNSECVQLMIDQGGFMEAHDCHYGTPLHVACARQHYDCAKVLLNAGANVNAAKLHETALHHAAKTKNIDLIELLVEFGANVCARDNLNKKPIQYTSHGSPSYLCLEFYENSPLSLQQISRVAVRKALGTRACKGVSKLGLPKRIVSFLSYKPPPIFES